MKSLENETRISLSSSTFFPNPSCQTKETNFPAPISPTHPPISPTQRLSKHPPISPTQSAAAKTTESSSSDAGAGDEDRLSALPDDVLVLILLHLSTEDAARTSVLSRRWRRLWTLIPELRFGLVRDSNCLPTALSASDVPLRNLDVGDPDASPQSLAAWLPAAARRVSGELSLDNFVPVRKVADREAEAPQRGTFELPCFEKATSIRLTLGFLGLSVQPAGVFARLTNLHLGGVRFHGPGELGDAVSSPRCPCLQVLTIGCVLGLDSITINSESLRMLDLTYVPGLRKLTVVAPVLKALSLFYCFLCDTKQPIVNISAPQLKSLKWTDAYDPSSVHIGSMKHLEKLDVLFSVYGPEGSAHNTACLMLLPQFKAIENLVLFLVYLPVINNLQYLMEDMTMLPHVTSLNLIVRGRKGHAFGASIFHILRICSGIERLKLELSYCSHLEEQICSGCICDQPTNWKTEDLPLNCLQDLEIVGLRGSDHEVAFFKRVLNWVTLLKTMTVTFSLSVTERKAKELFKMFQSFCRPGVCMKFYVYQKLQKVIYAPED